MISWSSSFASSTPATSLKVTFFCCELLSLALLLPKESARLPEPCIWRMKKTRKAIMMMMGVQLIRCAQTEEPFASRALTSTPCESSLVTRASY